TPQCLKCHVLGKEMDPSEFESSFSKEDGVQCESCHGPGSEYKKLAIMKDKEKAKENGLIVHDNKEAFCTTCHNSESPTFNAFNYDEMWAKIVHKKP
ncbi:MAG: cytochrome C554, partial [Ignavibacteria bacterium]|nr:cytochrome C554 [Ignavibacteria bacterium]